VFRAPAAIGVQWAVLLAHPDDPALLFAVPADDNPLAGTGDLDVPAVAACGPLTLRCGHGLWIPAADLAREPHTGFLEEEYLQQARQLLARLTAAGVESTPAQQDVDDDPEYEEWLEQIEAAREAVAAWLHEPAVIHFPDDFTQKSADAEWEQVLALVAEPSGTAGEVLKTWRQALSGKALRRQVAYDHPGALYLVGGEDHLLLLWQGTKRRPPAVRVMDKRGRLRRVRWLANAAKTAYRSVQPLSWSGGQIVLFLGPNEGQKVTIRR
jgi:hypothetical protein